MNRQMVRYLLAKLLFIEALLLLPPFFVALIYQEDLSVITSIGATIALLLVFSGVGIYFKPKNQRIHTKEALLIVALCWIFWSIFGALPFVFSGQIPDFIDAFFEISSGFTTTGATILPDVSVLSHSLLFWRSFTHLIGGMGVLVFALAILDNSSNNHLEVMRAEVPGPIFGKVVSKLKDTAQILYVLYLSMFVILVGVLLLAGLPLYDSLITAMGCAGTGGFAVFNDSIAHYHSSLITNIVAIAVVLFGINFNLYYFLLLRKFKGVFKDEELRTYIIIVITATALIWLNVNTLYSNGWKALELTFFQVANTITTTGYGITDLTVWPLFSQVILLFLMLIGGSAGSTAGGLKVMRLLILSKISKNQILSTLYPNRVLTLQINQQRLDDSTQRNVLNYIAVYLFVLSGLIFILSLDSNNFMVVISAAFSTFNNIGPLLGTSDTFAIFSPFSKLILSFAMIAGRLEIYPILLLFTSRAWSRY